MRNFYCYFLRFPVDCWEIGSLKLPWGIHENLLKISLRFSLYHLIISLEYSTEFFYNPFGIVWWQSKYFRILWSFTKNSLWIFKRMYRGFSHKWWFFMDCLGLKLWPSTMVIRSVHQFMYCSTKQLTKFQALYKFQSSMNEWNNQR